MALNLLIHLFDGTLYNPHIRILLASLFTLRFNRCRKANLGCVKSASAFKNCLGKVFRCHLTDIRKESAYIINIQ